MTLTSAPGSSSRARSAALIPASLPPIMTRCMAGSLRDGCLAGLALARQRAGVRRCAVVGGAGLFWAALAGVVGEEDVGGLLRGEAGVQGPDHQHGEGPADDLGGDERRY